VPQEDLDALFEIDRDLWLQEADLTEEFYRTFEGGCRRRCTPSSPLSLPPQARGGGVMRLTRTRVS
jgi:hypothetical protein